MKTAIIPLDSYTAAKKAVRVLAQHSISAKVEKMTSRRGCTFGIRTSAPPDVVCDILSDANIRCGSSVPNPQFPPPPPPPTGRPPRKRRW